MPHLLTTIVTAVVVFAATNLDDLVVLSFLFLVSRAGGRRLRPWQVLAGQAVGIAVLIASAAVAAVGLVIAPTRWIGLLGLFPLGLGLWRLIGAIRHNVPDNGPPASLAAA